MKNLKKHYEIFKLNRRISHLRGELTREIPSPLIVGNSFAPIQRKESEKSFLIRENLNVLRDQKEALKKS